MAAEEQLLRHSAVMAVGTGFSKISGYARSLLLAAALGNLIRGDIFSIANDLPNMLYFMVGAGLANAVLVPQMVRAVHQDPDGGRGYTNRVLTLAALVFGGATIVLMIFAGPLMRLFIDPTWPPEAFEATVFFARLCLPQIFFYGMFVIVGELLNARGVFGPMMWAPITNNLVSCAVLGVYLLCFGVSDPRSSGFSLGEYLLLGVGSTVGIAVQFLVLFPYLRAAGVNYSPQFDFIHTGLGRTFKLGIWVILSSAVNQLAYVVVVRLATSGTADVTLSGAGYTAYSSAYLMSLIPQTVFTVSLATALLPQLSRHAHEGDLRAIAADTSSTLRLALTVAVPFAFLFPLESGYISRVVWGYGAATHTVDNYAPILAWSGPGLVFLTATYVMLRVFFARDQQKTAFWMQVILAAVTVVASLVLVHLTTDRYTGVALIVANAVGYGVTGVIVYVMLDRALGGMHTATLGRMVGKLLLACAVATLAGMGAAALLPNREAYSTLVALGYGLIIGNAFATVLVIMARVLQIKEITNVVEVVTAQFRRLRQG